MSLVMKFRDIEGSSDEDKYKNWIHIDTCSFGISNSYKNKLQDVYQAKLKPNVSSIEITREVDEATSQIIAAVANAEVGDCEIHFANASANEVNPLVSLTLSDAQITNHGFHLNAKGSSSENLTVTFAKYKFNYTPVSDANKQKAGYLFEGHTELYDDPK